MATNISQEYAHTLQILIQSVCDMVANGIINRPEARALLIRYGVLTNEDTKEA